MNVARWAFITAVFLAPCYLHAECVVLLHGLARSDLSFLKMEAVLERRGFQVVNNGYPSTDMPIEQLAPITIAEAVSQCDADRGINFVTHSMGGILVRYYLKDNALPNLKNTVMLAPPNAGSEIVDALGGWHIFRWINGPAGTQLGTAKGNLPSSLGAVTYSVGVIAGSYSYNPLLSQIIPGADDGKVAVSKTRVAGMSDHIVLPVSHPFIMNNSEVIKQTLYFLDNGRFMDSQKFPHLSVDAKQF